jgi:hypothetical protein
MRKRHACVRLARNIPLAIRRDKSRLFRVLPMAVGVALRQRWMVPCRTRLRMNMEEFLLGPAAIALVKTPLAREIDHVPISLWASGASVCRVVAGYVLPPVALATAHERNVLILNENTSDLKQPSRKKYSKPYPVYTLRPAYLTVKLPIIHRKLLLSGLAWRIRIGA